MISSSARVASIATRATRSARTSPPPTRSAAFEGTAGDPWRALFARRRGPARFPRERPGSELDLHAWTGPDRAARTDAPSQQRRDSAGGAEAKPCGLPAGVRPAASGGLGRVPRTGARRGRGQGDCRAATNRPFASGSATQIGCAIQVIAASGRIENRSRRAASSRADAGLGRGTA